MTATTLDPQVFAHLIRQGVMTTDRVTRRPTTRACRTCHTPVIAAIEDEQAARMRVELTPAFLTPYGELQAITAGVGTFGYTPDAIWWRDPCMILGHPANIVPVMAEHTCNGIAFDAGPSPAQKKARPPAPTQCPF